MGNVDNKKLIRIWGVTLPESKFMVKSYGYGLDDIEIDGKKHRISYVEYRIADLIALIKNQELEKVFIKNLKENSQENRKTNNGT